MKRLINICTFVLGVFFLCNFMGSCNRYPPVSGAIFHETFITYYVVPEQFVVGHSGGNISLGTRGNIIGDGEVFDTLSRFYNDVSYNTWVWYGPTRAILGEIKSIKLETIEAFDECHLAGSDISDLVELQYISYYDFVQNGYSEEVPQIREDYEDMSVYFGREGAKIYKVKLSEIDYSDMKLVATDFLLKFLSVPKFHSAPIEGSVHRFRLTFQTQNNRIETLIEHEF